MAVYPNNRYASASPYRQLGGAAPGFDALQSTQTARKNRFSNATWSGTTGGDRATGLLPLTPGAMGSTQSSGIGLTVPLTPISRGVNLTALPVTLGVTPDPAPLQLKTFTSGSVTATLSSVVPQLSQLVAITGESNTACIIAAAPLQATGTLTIAPPVVLISTASHVRRKYLLALMTSGATLRCMCVKTFFVWLVMSVWLAFGAWAQVSMESVANVRLSYWPRTASATTTTTLATRDLFSQWGLPPGSLICCGNAFDRNQAWTFKHRTKSANGATATDTELAGRIDMEILGYSDLDTSEAPQSTAPSGSVGLGRVTRTATVKITVSPSGTITHEFWGSLISSFNAVQEKGRTDASWVPLSMSMRLIGWTDANGPADGGAAALTMTLGSFKRVAASSGTGVTAFAKIPGGTYQMGNLIGDSNITDAGTVTVTLSPYYMAVNDTTKAQWDTVRTWASTNGYTDLAVGAGKASNHPVQTVKWYDVVKWANAASEKEGLTPCYQVAGSVVRTGTSNAVTCDWSANGYRLPTEAEWEVAARGGLSGKRFPWGNTISHSQANYKARTSDAYDLSGPVNDYHPTYKTGVMPYTSPVGSFTANGYGLYDMAGNVYQWCWDWYGAYAGGIDPIGPESGSHRMLRGGHFGLSVFIARSAYRSRDFPTSEYNVFGFRLARGRL